MYTCVYVCRFMSIYVHIHMYSTYTSTSLVDASGMYRSVESILG